jgi:hypothetical protein
MRLRLIVGVAVMFAMGFAGQVDLAAGEKVKVHADFSKGLDGWQPTDTTIWESKKLDDGTLVAYVKGQSKDYQPKFRSPHSILLKKDLVLGSFTLTAKVKTTQTSRAHRDLCVFFGWQDPEHFYYVHNAEQTDPAANQVFIVNEAPRILITESGDNGTKWGQDEWHDIKLVRDVESGLIEMYFDDMEKPKKVAHDKKFTWGAVGIGTFDDHGYFKDVVIEGEVVEKEVKLPVAAK